MCGFTGTTNHPLARLMIKKQEHRGPDALDFWSDETFSFGHALLDISQERQLQPYKTERGNIILFNGEMYDTNNPNDTVWLAKGLEIYGFKFLENTDWHGSIAWYKPKEHKLVLIRDHFGAKPLWWRNDGEHFEFATSLKSFIHKEVDSNMIQSYNRNGQLFGDESIYKHTHKVEAGGWLEFKTDENFKMRRKNLWKWYDIGSEKLDTAEFRHKVKESVKKVAKNKNKTGLFLSGGLDSSCVASILKDSEVDIEVFTCGYNMKDKGHHWQHEGFNYEHAMAIKTAKELGYKVHTTFLDRDDRFNYGKMWLADTHYPWADHNRQAPRYLLAKLAADSGCKVILTGDSGDELFTGYLHHKPRLDEGYCRKMMKQYESFRWFPYQAFGGDYMNNTFFCDLLSTSEQNILATDQTCGMFGMESRIPLLTQSFAKYVLSIMGKVKFRQQEKYEFGTNKFLMREVMGEYLPEHVRLRNKKVGWSSPWDNNHPQLSAKWKMYDVHFIKQLSR
ncbi:MAG: hypothetical protein CL489_02350 [Acidobacteria bacterium]|nr:hypothetical protein [Acidobacteriota bacterium]|tara:strand:+ start:1235 stop:2749 length:1515 start_codon:yes stop_codon:yes gene_type:complete